MVVSSGRSLRHIQAGCVAAAMLAAAGPARAASERVVYSFEGGSDGAHPAAGLINVDGTLYGTTSGGGSRGVGTVFRVTPAGVEAVVHSFNGYPDDGAVPSAGLINLGGALYGTTSGGGGSTHCAYGCGAVFKVTAAGDETLVYSFEGGDDGEGPIAGLINVSGTLYGTTYTGGGGTSCASGCGTVFRVTTGGAENVLHAFQNNPDGAYPYAGLTNVGGTLYGTTVDGGALVDYGTAFMVTAAGIERVVHSFGNEGCYPRSNLVDVGGRLYGTTTGCGKPGGGYPDGEVFTLTKTGAERVKHTFNGNPDGAAPYAGLADVGGTFYGTTVAGGTSNYGTVFEMTKAGHETVLYSFAGGSDGANPYAGLINVGGTLYGTTYGGGSRGFGTVFMITP